MDQSSTKTQHGKLQAPCPMSKGLDGSLDLPLIPGIVDCNTFVSLGLDSIPVYSSPWQISHGSDIYNILKSLTKSRLYLHSLTKWHILVSVVFLNCGRRFQNPSTPVSLRTLKPEAGH